MMQITDVRINLTKGDSAIKAFASITLENEFVVSSIRVLDGKNGLFISMPQSKSADFQYHDICFPLSKELREAISDDVIDKYNDVVDTAKKSKRRG